MKQKLTPMKKSEQTYTIVGFDTEFCGKHLGKDSFVLGTISYPKNNGHDSGKDLAFEDPYKFVEEILRRKNRKVRFYAHNLSVDLANGIEPFLPDDYKFEVMKVGNRVIKATVTDNNKHQWTFYDSSQISGYAPLKTIGEIVGIEKLDPDIDLTGCNCNLEVTDKFKEYGKIDSRIVTEWMNNHLQPIINDKFNSQLDTTLAGTTMGIWRRNFQNEDYYILPEELRKEIRKGYNGGRTEVFKKGKRFNVNKYDVNSLYPFVYTEYEFPHPNYMNMIKDPSRKTLANHIQKEGFVTCKVQAPDIYIPYLKYFNEDLGSNGKLTFPVGAFKDTWTLLEIRKAVRLGYEILEVDNLIYSNQVCKPWESFAWHMYDDKREYGQKDMPAHYIIVKLLMNSLWGRFGVDPEGDEAGIINFSEDIGLIEEKINEIGISLTGPEADALREGELGFYFEPFDDRPPNYCHPEWAAYTTACARHELFKWFEMVGLENTIYCDTDSVLTTETIPNKYINDELGMMDLEFTGTFEAVREKGYVLYNVDGTVKEVVGSGINQERLGIEKAKDALLNNQKIEQQIWGGPSFGGVNWGKVDTIEKELGSHYVPKREYLDNNDSKPIKLSPPL